MCSQCPYSLQTQIGLFPSYLRTRIGPLPLCLPPAFRTAHCSASPSWARWRAWMWRGQCSLSCGAKTSTGALDAPQVSETMTGRGGWMFH